MRASRDCSESSQTKTGLSSEKISVVRVGDDGDDRFRTSAIRLDGRKGEKEPCTGVEDGIALALAQARSSWLEAGDPTALRSALLLLLLELEHRD